MIIITHEMVSTNLHLLNELLRQIYKKPRKSLPSDGSHSSLTSRVTCNCRCSISSNESNGSNDCNLSLHSQNAFNCDSIKCHYTHMDITRLHKLIDHLTKLIHAMNNDLVTSLRHRDFLYTEQSQLCDFITATLQAISSKTVSDAKLRFTIEAKTATDSSYKQWVDAMRMVVRLPGGIPPEFRRKLWITLSEKYIQSKQINWQGKIEACFSDRANPDDESLGEQIIKDLHRTGCDLFSGADASVNQALLKQVLLAFARWNKSVGYCQGFNILAAVILEVVEWKVEEALMVMIFLIEGLLPESYFANNLRGLSVDMAVFRDLMKIHLNDLSNHLDHLQYSSLEGVACYEPPLVNVFTLQWFLTLFSNCLPKALVLRIWDLIFLEGSEVLLRTALIIWSNLSAQIHSVKSADEFYSIMGIMMMQLMEYTTTDGNQLINNIISLADFPYGKVSELREKYTYHIRPLSTACNSPSATGGSSSPFSFVKRSLHLLPFTTSSDEDDANASDHFEFFFHQDQLMTSLPRPGSPCVTAAGDGATSKSSRSNVPGTSSPDRMSLDVSLLRKQYVKLCQRQKQAHLILTEGLRYGYSSTFNRAGSSGASDANKKPAKETVKKNHDKSTIESLLSGKPALTVKTSSKPPMVALPTPPKVKDTRETASLDHTESKKVKEKSTRDSSQTDEQVSNSERATVKDSSASASINRSCRPQVMNNLSEGKTRSTNSTRDSSSVHHKKVKAKGDSVKVNATNTSAKSDTRDDECTTSPETVMTKSDETTADRSDALSLQSNHSSSTSVNNSSSSSSIESLVSSASTVDTVVTKKRKKSDEAANGQSRTTGDGDASKTGKSSIVVVRRRFGPNVRRASSILEQSSFSVDEPMEGDDESTSSSETDQRDSQSKDNSSTTATTASKGVTSKRRDFQRRHQNTMTLTWSEIRKIRKTSAPAAVIRSSLSSPPSDTSPCDANVARSPVHEADVLSDNSCENSTSDQEKCHETIGHSQTVTENSTLEKREKVNVTDNGGGDGEHGEGQVDVLTLNESTDTPVASSSPCTSTSELCDDRAVNSVLDSCTHERDDTTHRPIDMTAQGEQTSEEKAMHDECVSPKNQCSTLTSTLDGEDSTDQTMGPDGEDTECESELQVDVPTVVSSLTKSVLESVNIVGDTSEPSTHRDDVTVCREDSEDGEERIIKSVQSEISNLTIEECLARLSARISTLNSELQ